MWLGCSRSASVWSFRESPRSSCSNNVCTLIIRILMVCLLKYRSHCSSLRPFKHWSQSLCVDFDTLLSFQLRSTHSRITFYVYVWGLSNHQLEVMWCLHSFKATVKERKKKKKDQHRVFKLFFIVCLCTRYWQCVQAVYALVNLYPKAFLDSAQSDCGGITLTNWEDVCCWSKSWNASTLCLTLYLEAKRNIFSFLYGLDTVAMYLFLKLILIIFK